MTEYYAIYPTENGYIFYNIESVEEYRPVVFEARGDEPESEALSNLLWEIKNVLAGRFGQPDGKYSRDRLYIITEVGEKYELREDEVLVETKHYRVRKKTDKLEYGEKIVKEE